MGKNRKSHYCQEFIVYQQLVHLAFCGSSHKRVFFAFFLWALLPRIIVAQPDQSLGSEIHTYAVVVGSNPGGEGQNPLKFAEQDAQRVGELLSEIGRYRSQNVQVLLSPQPQEVLEALDALAEPLAAHRAADEQAVVFFYYSGHARASAMNLGEGELMLSELRERLLSLPTTLTIVVLDACQSGAFSRIKGAEPAADFSFNSVSRLNTSGVAVMASSSDSELSQESESLQSSYFTHHLVVALRGGGDGNQDGRVSLDEAYRYAHNHTLADTSRTAVGGQHPTLQTELTGQGDVPLTYPAEAKAQLELAKELSSEVLIQKPSGGAIMAELYKAAGQSLLLAFPAGRYDLVLRSTDKGESSVRQCSIELTDDRVMTLNSDACPLVPITEADVKGKRDAGSQRDAIDEMVSEGADGHERWAIELSSGLAFIADDNYTERLQQFGYCVYSRDFSGMSGRFSLRGLYQLNSYLGLALQVQFHEQSDNYQRCSGLSFPPFTPPYDYKYSLSWETYTVTLSPRGTLSLFDDWLALYAEMGIGIGFGFTEFAGQEEGTGEFTDSQGYLGYRLAAGGGIQLNFWRYMGMFVEASYDYAPIIENLMGETRNSGGFFLGLGLRLRIWS
jgi:hypothetical protein